jgi:hypothetical protein
VGQERLAAASGVGAHEHINAVAVRVGQLHDRLVEHGDVVGGGVGPGPTRPQDSSEGLAGVVAEREDRVVAKVFFHVGVACSFSEWVTTMEASISMTRPGTSRPPAFEAGRAPRISTS